MLGFPILYFKGMRPMMFQLSGFYCIEFRGLCYGYSKDPEGRLLVIIHGLCARVCESEVLGVRA